MFYGIVQDFIIESSKNLVIPTEEEGICYGFAIMAVFAGLAGYLEKFSWYIEEVKEFYRHGDQVEGENKKDKKIKVFLENLNRIQKINNFKYLLPKNMIVKNSNSKRDKMHLFATVELRILPENIFPKGNKQLLTVASWSGCYTRAELDIYLNQITELTTHEPIGLLLGNVEHAIGILYHPSGFEIAWTLIDANKGIIPCDIIRLKSEIFSSFECKNKDYVVFLSSLLQSKDSNLFLEKFYKSTANDWEKIHRVTAEKAKFENSSWLHAEAENGNIVVVRKLIRAGAQVNAVNSYGSTPIITAVKNNHLQVVKELITTGAKINHSTGNGETLISIAAGQKNKKILKLLIATHEKNEAKAKSLNQAALEPTMPPTGSFAFYYVSQPFLLKHNLPSFHTDYTENGGSFREHKRTRLDCDPNSESFILNRCAPR